MSFLTLIKSNLENAKKQRAIEKPLAPLRFRLQLTCVAFVFSLIGYIGISIYIALNPALTLPGLISAERLPQLSFLVTFMLFSTTPVIFLALYRTTFKGEALKPVSMLADLTLSATLLVYLFFGRDSFTEELSKLIVYEIGLFAVGFLLIGAFECFMKQR